MLQQLQHEQDGIQPKNRSQSCNPIQYIRSAAIMPFWAGSSMTEATYKIICIPDILEEILLQLDICTFLTSAQRVCLRWHTLIQNSDALQAALFMKPSKEQHKWDHNRIQNSLIKANLWPQYFRKQLRSQRRHHSYNQYQPPLTLMKRENECTHEVLLLFNQVYCPYRALEL